ncbi:MAG: DUF934 domain-containing protein [Gammaproteobacteria bacterium]|nr:DUF934 domain-containing protein [Gammaproteobacteria bacterium]NIR85537.1 DUF934 domain-containing protein [Gammaproteobacteria bacterium]NIR89796.1 DUF934 domain-containing protein [Gammaproteobacteria bacterium]NIU06672.1 DUF934 domain-containing protein [Gammaproteobacteria bacterium]NIV75063.1 DUF934 domain-containing protein [Gammaproteobacteria bacterium]
MRIIRNRRIVNDDWRHAPEAGPLPAGDVIVPLARWHAERRDLLAHAGGLGVRLRGDDDPYALAQDLRHFRVVALELGRFNDGRAFSQARILRETLGYEGELRAVGDVLRDHLSALERCGVDAYELPPHRDLDDALRGFDEISVAYQPPGAGTELIFRRRAREQRAGAGAGAAQP